MADSLLGKPTGKFTQAGRPIIKISKDIKENGKVIIKKGSNVSEISRTIHLPDDKWANIPSVYNNKKYSEDVLRKAILEKRLIPTSIHNSHAEAKKAAKARSKSLFAR